MSYEEMIKRCARFLASGQGVMQGGTKTVASPMVSVFLGEGARENEETVRAVYSSTWLEDARVIKCCDAGYSADREESLRIGAMQAGYDYPDQTASYICYYWDVMDDGFDDSLSEVTAALRDAERFSRPTRYFFIFFSQARREEIRTAKERLEKLFSLIYETEDGQEKQRRVKRKDVHFVLLGNMSGGTFVGSRISENYRLAADISVILNSRDRNGRLAGGDLAFNLRDVPVMSAGYHSEGKPVREIVCSSLEYLLEKYRELSENAPEISFAKAIADRYGGYTGLFGQVFERYVRQLLPENYAFLRYVPYTSEVGALDRFCSGDASFGGAAAGSRGGFFGRHFGGQSVPQVPAYPGRGDARAGELAAAAVRSLGTFWDAVMEQYFSEPVHRWWAGGAADVRESLESSVAQVLTYRQMRDPAIQNEAEGLIRKTEREVRAELAGEMRMEGLAFDQILAEEAELYLKTRLYTAFYHMLGSFVREFSENAGSFTNVLKSVSNRLRADQGDASIGEAYGTLLDRDLTGREDEVRAAIRPCGNEDALCAQLEKFFAGLAPKEEVYRYTYPEELNWRLGAVNPAKITDIISGCFNYDVRNSVRVNRILGITGGGYAYSIMSTPEAIKNEIEAQNINVGDIFAVPRSDYIERIYIQPVDPDDIAW